MSKKLYVGGLSYSTTEDGLREAFAQAGPVASATVIMDRMSGRSKGFGFVEFETEEAAQAGIQMWDGQQLDGRRLKVSEARPKEDRPRSGGYNRGGGRGDY